MKRKIFRSPKFSQRLIDLGLTAQDKKYLNSVMQNLAAEPENGFKLLFQDRDVFVFNDLWNLYYNYSDDHITFLTIEEK